jgi:multicomponent Na+:H+ antiporter subunit G
MDIVFEIVSWMFLLAGAVMLVIGAIGIVRLPDVFARMHGAGIIDTMGVGSVLIGLMLQAGLSIVTIKLALIVVFILFTSPTSTHALAQAALHGGVRPQLDGSNKGDSREGGKSSKT